MCVHLQTYTHMYLLQYVAACCVYCRVSTRLVWVREGFLVQYTYLYMVHTYMHVSLCVYNACSYYLFYTHNMLAWCNQYISHMHTLTHKPKLSHAQCLPHIHKHVHTYILTHIHTYTHTHIHKHIHKHIHTYINTYTHIYLHSFILIDISHTHQAMRWLRLVVSLKI